jgi:hypothetical protein
MRRRFGVSRKRAAAAALAAGRASVDVTIQTGAVLLVCAAVLDLITFAQMVELHGPVAELNPIMRAVLMQAGLTGVLLLKMVAAVTLALAALRLARRRFRVHAWIIVTAGVLAWTAGAWTNGL